MAMNFFSWLKVLRKKSVRTAKRRSQLQLVLESLEDRIQPTVSVLRPIDESGNNVAQPALGTANTDLVRISHAAYADGVSSPSLPNNPSARVLSDLLNNQAGTTIPPVDANTLDAKSLTDFGYTWGQFIDHDMDLTTTNSGELLQILADPNDPSQMGNQTFVRSTFDPATGTSTSNPRQQVNAVTSFLDLSQVYGSTTAIADALRTHSGGLLKTSPGNMLPYDNSTYFTSAQLALFSMANDSGMVPTQSLFATGDVRGNENTELTALQTLFVRNHNNLAAQLQKMHPDWTDEQLYQEARKLNIAEYQQITYNYYLPDLLGPTALKAYTGYKPTVDPAIATEFSTIAFRFGHSLLDNGIERQGNNGLDLLPNDPAGASISLAEDFFDPNLLNPTGATDPFTSHTSTDIGPILKANADGIAQAMDLQAVESVRNLLFGNGGQSDNGMDLMARDIERARDNGIGTYNQVRKAYGLAPVTSFAQITSDVTVQNQLKAAYGTVDNIDPFEGGLAEDHVRGSDMGPLFTRILVDQFTRLRDGDRFFYLNESFNREELSLMGQGNTLAKVIEANTNVTNLQQDVFVFQASISGTVGLALGGGKTAGLASIQVNLLDASGALAATTTTDRFGNYNFTMTGTGDYTVSLVLPSTLLKLSKDLGKISISRGNTNIKGANFLVGSKTSAAPHEPAAPSGQDLLDHLGMPPKHN